MNKKEDNKLAIKVVAFTALWIAFAAILYTVIKN
jgi:hypothetical protein